MTVSIVNHSVGTQYEGLSTDTKPTGVVINSTFVERDTAGQPVYITYDGTNWVLRDPVGEVAASPTANTLLGRLDGIADQLTSLIAAVATNGVTRISQSVADEASITLTDASLGVCYVTCNGEYTMFSFFADGTCQELSMGSTNIDYANTDGCLCVLDTGTQVGIKNRLGSTYTIQGFVVYLT